VGFSSDGEYSDVNNDVLSEQKKTTGAA